MNVIKFILTLGLISSVTVVSTVHASVGLPVGAGPVFLPGSTAALEADLGGPVVSDQVIPFRILNRAGALLFMGQLQNRVVKSSRSGVLHFYYRIRDTKQGLNGIIRSIISKSFVTTPSIQVDWRPDGLGSVNPIEAQRSLRDGSLVQFNFDIADMVMVGGTESKFFYIKTTAQNFNLKGQTKILLTSGDSVLLNTAAPL
jgi:hypothetical protein